MSFLQGSVRKIKRKVNALLGKKNITVKAPRLTSNNNKEQDIYYGASGFVFRYRGDPTKVFKIYLKNIDIYNERNKANKVVSITKDARQKVEIVEGLKFWDLPENAQPRIPHHLRNGNLTAIRMNDLGVDLHTCTEKHLHQLASIPNIVPILLAQFYKLLHQVDQLHRGDLYHCDIRLENIMIDLETCTLTLIDFDLLDTLSESNTTLRNILLEVFKGESEITSTWPIEWLVIGNEMRKSKLSNDTLVELYETPEMLELCKITHNARIVEAKMNLQDYFKTYLYSVLNKITPIINGDHFTTLQLISGFDTFGLGFAFSYLFNELQNNRTFKANSDPIHKKLLNGALNIAKKMCVFDITLRTPLDVAVLGMRHFLQTNGIPLPVLGGRRRQTRRR
jgi:hypothetical protein